MPNPEPNSQSVAAKWPAIVAVLLVVLLAAVVILRSSFSPYIRSWTVRALRERYLCDVAFDKLEVSSVFPEIRVSGEGLVLRYRGRKDVPPLASIRKLSVEGSLLGFVRSSRRFRRLELDGLEINVTHSQEPNDNRNRAKRSDTFIPS